MTLEDVQTATMDTQSYRKKMSKTLVTLLRKAQFEKRLTCAMVPAIKMLEMDPERALFCILPQSRQGAGDAALHIQSVLLQAFCYENNINIIKVDSADKLAAVIELGASKGPRLDCSCVLVHRPWDENLQLSDQEKELANFCVRTSDMFPPLIIQLPES